MIPKELRQLILIHFKELIREPGVLFWGIAFPIVMAWGLGIAFSGDRETRKQIAVTGDPGHSRLYEWLSQHMEADTADDAYHFTIEDPVFGRNIFSFVQVDPADAITGVKRGKYQLFLESAGDSLIFHMDPANPEARLLQMQLSALIEGREGAFRFSSGEIEALDMKGTRYIDFLIPGLLAMGIMMACMWGMSWTLIERRKGLMLRRMVVTPMHRYNLLLGLMTARLSMNLAEALILLLFAFLYFGMVLQGSVLALVLVFFAGNLAFTGIAILVSSRTSNTEIGNGLINFVTMPMMVLSGIFFSYHNFPDWAIPVIQKLPLTMLADSIRSIFNEGAGLGQVMPEVLILSAIGLLSFVGGIRIFRWY